MVLLQRRLSPKCGRMLSWVKTTAPSADTKQGQARTDVDCEDRCQLSSTGAATEELTAGSRQPWNPPRSPHSAVLPWHSGTCGQCMKSAQKS